MPKPGWRSVSLPDQLLAEVEKELDGGALETHTSLSAYVEYAVRKELDRVRDLKTKKTRP